MRKHVASVCILSTAGWMLASASTGFAGHARTTHAATSHPSKSHHEAPKHPGGKPAHHAAPETKATPKGHPSHKSAAGNSGTGKQAAGKSNGPGPSEHKSSGLVAGSKPHDKSHEHDHEHHDHHHHHRHWNGHEWVDGVDVEGGVVGGSLTGGTSGSVVPGDPGVVVAPSIVGSGVPGRPQIQFSVDPSERDSYEAAANAAGMSRSEWIRSRLNAAAGRELK